MEDNESCDREKGHERKGMSNKSSSLLDSPCKIQKEESRGSTPISPLRMPDLPLPTPPPMANIMMTSRIGYRRILGNRGPEYRSPILGHRSHSMEFSSRSPSFYGNLPNAPILDSMRQDYYASRESVVAKNVESQARSQTLDCRRQVFRENRANTVEFTSPMMARAYLGEREKSGTGRDRRVEAVGRQAMLTDQLGLSPLPRHRNFEHLNKRLEDFNEYPIYPHLYNLKSPDPKITQEHRSKYFSRDSVLSSELEEVRTINKELQRKYVVDNAEENISRILGSSNNSETSPEYYSVFMNEHYISDIDENEEIKEFACGYRPPPERRYSDQTDRQLQKSASTFSFYTYQPTTLPTSFKKAKKCSKKSNKTASVSNISSKSVLKSTKSSKLSRTTSEDIAFSKYHQKKNLKKVSTSNLCDAKSLFPATYTISSTNLPIGHSRYSGSVSSMKSSDYYSFVPVVTSSVKKVEFSGDSTGKVIKSPQRTVVKLAKISSTRRTLSQN